METKQAFKALSKICLNNWHYISRKTLSFSEEINFFTGHSGSGKSTVIDAMQIVLYANTDGRGFFNKAAADDSDRSLIEYLRGMVNIGENNEFAYLRNRNFSTTIVLELKQTDTEECQCVGIVFDVETASNEISRKFFWHKGPLWENNYRTEGRAMTIAEVEEELQLKLEELTVEAASEEAAVTAEETAVTAETAMEAAETAETVMEAAETAGTVMEAAETAETVMETAETAGTVMETAATAAENAGDREPEA